MGSFYTNVTVVGAGVDEVAAWLGTNGLAAHVGPQGGAVLVFERDGESQDGSHEQMARRVAAATGATTLAALVHDSDLLALSLFAGDQHVGAVTIPDPVLVFGEEAGDLFGEGGPVLDAGVLAAAFGVDPEPVEAALDGDRVFAEERHAELVAALGLPTGAVGTGFEYIEAGEAPDGVELRRVGP